MFKMSMGNDIEFVNLKLGLLREIQFIIVFFFNKTCQHLRGLLATS